MARNMLWFAQNTYNSNYMRANFIDLKPNYKTNNLDVRSNPIALVYHSKYAFIWEWPTS